MGRRTLKTISIVIPALNEAQEIRETLARTAGADEILVVDGGSADPTRAIALECGARIIDAPPGRAGQLNLGATATSSDIVLFLHADTWLPPGWRGQVFGAFKKSETVGGAFARKFRSDSVALRFTCWLAFWRNRAFGWHLGDQAIFCRRDVFEELGGFAPMRPFEDLDFSRRLGRKGKLVTLRPGVVSSARRFEGGAMRRSLADAILTMRYVVRPGQFRV